MLTLQCAFQFLFHFQFDKGVRQTNFLFAMLLLQTFIKMKDGSFL